jgi:hypothetical protein
MAFWCDADPPRRRPLVGLGMMNLLVRAPAS